MSNQKSDRSNAKEKNNDRKLPVFELIKIRIKLEEKNNKKKENNLRKSPPKR